MKNSVSLFTLLLGILLVISACRHSVNKSEPIPSYSVTISADPAEGGTVTPTNGTYPEGDSLAITAEPAQGWRFVHWEGDFEGTSSPATITVGGDMEIRGIFAEKEYELTVDVEGQGTVEEKVVENGEEYQQGAVVQLTAVGADGWRFDRWEGDLTGSENPETISMDEPKEVTAVFIKKSYPLTVNTSGGGTVSEQVIQAKTTEYTFDTQVQLTANPETGWVFDHWEGDLTGSQNPETITVNEAKTVTAVFTQKSYPLNVNISGSGTVTKNPDKTEYAHGSSVELTATPSQGWKFVEWTGDVSSLDNPLEITMNTATSVTAVFEQREYPLTINTEGQGAVSEDVIEGTAPTKVKLTATAATGWSFDRWEGDLTGSNNPETITVDKAKTITAVFEKESYELTINTQGEGTVTEEVIKSKSYPYETVVQLTAIAENGWQFDHWEGDLTGSENREVIVVDEPKEVTAVFTKESYPLTVNTNGSGTVAIDPDKAEYVQGSSVELTANPSQGWTFIEWTGDVTSQDNPLEITMNTAKDVTAVFEKENYALTINIEGEGTVTEEVIKSKSYPYETVVQLTANVETGWQFDHWEGDLTGTESREIIIVDEPKEVTAVFTKESYSLSVNSSGSGTVAIEPNETAHTYNTEVTVTATAEPGWVFDHWEGDLSGSANPESITVNEDKNVTAVFVKENYPLTVNISGEGTVSEQVIQAKSTDYEFGTQVQLTAKPATGWKFVEWQGDLSGSDNPETITVDEAKTVTAVFEEITYTLNVTTEGEGTVSADPDKNEYAKGENIELTAEPTEGWKFTGWTGDITSNENPLTFTIDSNTSLTANFEKLPEEEYALSVTSSPPEGGSVSPSSGTYSEGTPVTIEATANDGWEFVEWTGDETSTVNPLTITMDSNKEITAVFEEETFTLSVTTDGEGTVSIRPPDKNEYKSGSPVTLKAKADSDKGWSFHVWEGDDVPSSEKSDNPLKITMDTNKKLTAVFTQRDDDDDDEDDEDDDEDDEDDDDDDD